MPGLRNLGGLDFPGVRGQSSLDFPRGEHQGDLGLNSPVAQVMGKVGLAYVPPFSELEKGSPVESSSPNQGLY